MIVSSKNILVFSFQRETVVAHINDLELDTVNMNPRFVRVIGSTLKGQYLRASKTSRVSLIILT